MRLSYKQGLGIAIIVIVFLLMIIFHIGGIFGIMSNLQEIWYTVSGGLLVFGAELIGFRRKSVRAIPSPKTQSKIDIDPNLVHLAVHYPRMKGKLDEPTEGRLRYVTYYAQMIAYRVPDWLNPYVVEHKISWVLHENESAMKKFFDEENITILEGDITPQHLGLRFNNKALVLAGAVSELISKLKGKKLENLLFIFLERRSYVSSPILRRLLIDFSEKRVWLSPSCDAELIVNKIVDFENKRMRFYESCERWCKRKYKNFTFMDRRYPDSKLLENVHTNPLSPNES